MATDNGNVKQDGRMHKEQRCTAPHPAVPFLLFLGTVSLGVLAFYLLRLFL